MNAKTSVNHALTAAIISIAVFAYVACRSAAYALVESPLVIVGEQHADIEVPLIGGVWTPSVRAGFDGNLQPENALLYVNDKSRTTRSSWESWTGAENGDTIWVLEQNSVSGELWLGLAARGCDSLGAWLPDDSRLSISYQYIQINLVDARGYDGTPAPGDICLWETDSYGVKTPWFSTAEGLADGNHAYMTPGGHAHFYWGFTARGIYEIDLQMRTYRGPGQTNLTVSPVVTFYLGVEAPIDGDIDLDGSVDDVDATILAVNWAAAGSMADWLHGDFDKSHTVDADDAALMAGYWLASINDESSAAAASEPSNVVMIVLVITKYRKCKNTETKQQAHAYFRFFEFSQFLFTF